ncbi:hypothetical protein FOXG_15060 [Fusarium oxysporum f. sp. lycopersici 4287]|uniref:Fungal N-terminal domain-containing protein n=3 Tax=Fusarium oxysporum TaxID=5507 RepID=A0A0J9WUC8_FUSO4|nr:hypothetical protein FOXG_14421 [Fusarium oxysporum f. sp. lycopersici 4287]XP_018255602.1 hypothetical protein FOXG_15060 [Fusarium oxysporum f. sp. lycopersici 4287]EXK23390.1 hypothetical protein FOMG_19831 [Fusarium oxysporum f. sp. melonis 26406]EXM14884.1 hypothetical protein FOTG_16757 [Fusarium oxysporum f. sp. vasinfectum 25433]KAK2923458.1 hypothetical protein FoTM2_016982 [Fusarium oxysporum f. sp. vasinfectum]KNB16598.1 hypothetical protein FOXG_14421 [Fusarium oxysporum f. sp. 
MSPLECIGGVIAIAQAVVGTCKAIDICLTPIKDSHETLDRWNHTSRTLGQISQQFEAVLRERKARCPNEESLEGTHYGVISAHLDRFNTDLQKLERNITKANLAKGSGIKSSFRNKIKLAFVMDWRENDQLFQWMDRHVRLLSVNRGLIKGVNDDNIHDIQRALGTGHASWKASPEPDVEMRRCLLLNSP